MLETLHSPLPVFILQLIIIILASQSFGWIFRKMKQPAVMGEIIAGIALGPSLVGSLFPSFNEFIFPVSSLPNLQMLSQVGLILFMFVIGMELDMNLVRSKMRTAVSISVASIVFPFALGAGLSYFLYKHFAPPDIPFYAFALFMGIAMSITAFPVLARVIKERGLMNTKSGSIALISASVNDIIGWCVLAFVIVIVNAGDLTQLLYGIFIAAGYILVMVFLVRPLLQKLLAKKHTGDKLSAAMIAIVFLVMLLSAYCSEVVGIHALFGAFLAGVIMPHKLNFRETMIAKIEDVALVLLLPLFFVLTGLRTHIGLLNSVNLWLVCGCIILVAIIGKFGGSALAARFKGESWEDSLSIGALMNTRGLMELVVLNIGYDLGILIPEVFAMMVIMAIATTLMTGPSLDLIRSRFNKT